MKTILAATDHSPVAVNAVEYAAQLARESGASLVLFSVYKVSIHASNSLASASTIQHMADKSEDRLREAAEEIADRFSVEVSWHLGNDDTIQSLKNYTLSNPVDLVVMGIESDLLEYKLIGNTTTAAIQLMQFPLLVVPNDIQYTGIGKILYACEVSYLKDNCELSVLKDLIRSVKAELTVFHVNTDHEDERPNMIMEQVMDRILHDVPHTFGYVNNPKVDDGIEMGLQQFPSDLLVMIPHKAGFFESLFKGSNTNQVTLKTRVPLLVIPVEKAC